MNNIDRTEDSLKLITLIIDNLDDAEVHMKKFQKVSGYNLSDDIERTKNMKEILEGRKFLIERIGVNNGKI